MKFTGARVAVTRVATLVSNRKPVHSAHFNNCQAVVGPHLAQHSMHVITHSLLGQAKLWCNFLVRHTTAYEKNQLLLAISKTEAHFHVEAGHLLTLTCHVAKQ